MSAIVTTYVINHLTSIPAPVATAVLAMLPIIELKGAVPVALTIYNLSIPAAIFWSVIGNMIPVYILLVLLEIVSTWLRQHSTIMEKFFTWLFEHSRHKASKYIERFGWWGLAIIAGLPLPIIGGAWTAVLAAFVFGIDKKKSFFAILIGSTIGAIILVSLTLGTSWTLSATR